MNSKPKVLVFDDEMKWAKLIAKTLRTHYSVVATTNAKNWDKHVGSTNWDVIVVDVQLLGPRTGVDLAEEAILKYEITAPIIIISGNVKLCVIEKKYGKIFFGYVSKDNFNRKLLELVYAAYQDRVKGTHLKKMLTKIAKKHRVFDVKINPIQAATYVGITPLIGQIAGKTIGELINSIDGVNGKTNLTKIGRIILGIIHLQT